jgi:phytoene/squalene synthetase
MQSVEFYQAHLDRVSRSFAFCIRRLPQPLRIWVSLTYLVCRILDTIEDADWPNRRAQDEAFSSFESAITNREKSGALANCRFPDLIEGERKLIDDAESVFADFHELPENVRTAIRDLTLSMAHGMRHFLQRDSGGRLRLSTLSEVNQYCFFVAGLVGEALTHLVSSVEPRFPTSVANLLRAHHFGLFLQ